MLKGLSKESEMVSTSQQLLFRKKIEERCFLCSNHGHKELVRPHCAHQGPGKMEVCPRAVVEFCKAPLY